MYKYPVVKDWLCIVTISIPHHETRQTNCANPPLQSVDYSYYYCKIWYWNYSPQLREQKKNICRTEFQSPSADTKGKQNIVGMRKHIPKQQSEPNSLWLWWISYTCSHQIHHNQITPRFLPQNLAWSESRHSINLECISFPSMELMDLACGKICGGFSSFAFINGRYVLLIHSLSLSVC